MKPAGRPPVIKVWSALGPFIRTPALATCTSQSRSLPLPCFQLHKVAISKSQPRAPMEAANRFREICKNGSCLPCGWFIVKPICKICVSGWKGCVFQSISCQKYWVVMPSDADIQQFLKLPKFPNSTIRSDSLTPLLQDKHTRRSMRTTFGQTTFIGKKDGDWPLTGQGPLDTVTSSKAMSLDSVGPRVASHVRL